MTTYFIASLRNIEITERDPVVEPVPGLRLVADASAILSALPDECIQLVGEIDRAAYETATAVFAGAWSNMPVTTPIEAERIVSSLLGAIQSFLMALWYVRDNCVMCEGGVLLYPESSGGRVGWHGIKHALGQYFWNASVQHASTNWSRADLTSASTFAARAKAVFGAPEESISVHPVLPKSVGRLLRGLYYLENARMCADVGVRVSSYVSCLEALFSTDSAELSHKLSERVAIFLADGAAERVALYKDVKRAYSVRSKVVHGDDLDDKQRAQVLQVSTMCDDLLRRVFMKILSDEEAAKLFQIPKQELEDRFVRRTFGADPISTK